MIDLVRFAEPTERFPSIKTDVYEWKRPLKEGGNKNDPDEIIINKATIFNNIIFSEQYVITQQFDKKDEIIKYVERKLIEAINQYV